MRFSTDSISSDDEFDDEIYRQRPVRNLDDEQSSIARQEFGVCASNLGQEFRDGAEHRLRHLGRIRRLSVGVACEDRCFHTAALQARWVFFGLL